MVQEVADDKMAEGYRTTKETKTRQVKEKTPKIGSRTK